MFDEGGSKMDKNKIIVIIYYIVAVICDVCAIMCFCSLRPGLGALWIGIGTAIWCIGHVWLKRRRDTDVHSKEG